MSIKKLGVTATLVLSTVFAASAQTLSSETRQVEAWEKTIADYQRNDSATTDQRRDYIMTIFAYQRHLKEKTAIEKQIVGDAPDRSTGFEQMRDMNSGEEKLGRLEFLLRHEFDRMYGTPAKAQPAADSLKTAP